MLPARSPRRPPLGLGIAAVGFGIALWYGWDWYQLPRWSEADIEQSVELNLRLDLQRLGGNAPSGQDLADLRADIRRELQAEIAREIAPLRQGTQSGLLMGLAGLALTLLGRWVRRSP